MEPDISILRKTGHFYFALTQCRYNERRRPPDRHIARCEHAWSANRKLKCAPMTCESPLWIFCSQLWTTPTEGFSLQSCNRWAISPISIGGVPTLLTLIRTGVSALRIGGSSRHNGTLVPGSEKRLSRESKRKRGQRQSGANSFRLRTGQSAGKARHGGLPDAGD